jgi:LysR family transcriptional regulator of beta-lactamase
MPLSTISLNALRAFEAASRYLSFTKAAEELCVTPAAVGHQVKALEDHFGVALFHRTARGLVLTDEGARLAPPVGAAFGQLVRAVESLGSGKAREIVAVAAVGTFATGFLMPRLADFRARHPDIDLRVQTNNNKVDLWVEPVDYAIRFGDGAWHGVDATPLLSAPIAPLCAASLAASLARPSDLAGHTLLRSYRTGEWEAWLAAAGVPRLVARGPQFDSSVTMVQAALAGAGIALAPPRMFERELAMGALVQPFRIEVETGAYWLTCLKSRQPRPAMLTFATWLTGQCGSAAPA